MSEQNKAIIRQLSDGLWNKRDVRVFDQSGADRDGMLQSDMERGVNDSHERLDELLEKSKKASQVTDA
jgi:hypothetical protein